MKKIKLMMITLMMCFVVVSCGDSQPTRDEIVKTNVETQLKTMLNDPSSYEFVKLELLDSVTFKDNIEYRKEEFKSSLVKAEADSIRLEGYREDSRISYMFDETQFNRAKDGIEKNKTILSKIDSIEHSLGDKVNDVASFTYLLNFRSNNGLGVLTLGEYIVQTGNPNFKIINITNDPDKVYLNPDDFPGYIEMITNMLVK